MNGLILHLKRWKLFAINVIKKILFQKIWHFQILQLIFILGGGNLSELYTSRVIDFTTNLFFMIVAFAFSAVLQSYLTITIPPPPFQNLHELLEDKLYTLGAVYNGYEKEYFKVIFLKEMVAFCPSANNKIIKS